jgi:hypothetical protein
MRARRPLSGRRSIATFDSGPAMVQSLAAALHGRPFTGMGAMPPSVTRALAPLAGVLNRLPASSRQWVYARTGILETVPERKLGRLDGEAVAAWLVGRYPDRSPWPAAVIGSPSGALTHLCAAVGMPFLPQGFLVPVRQRGRHVDDAGAEVALGRAAARRVLAANPDLHLHQMQDPNQDRLMLSHIRYFRMKWRRLPEAYSRWLARTLPPGATLLVSECRLRWPVTRLGERHVFQFGGHGALSADGYRRPSRDVAAFLAQHDSPRRRWSPPDADEDAAEAEWGLAPEFLADVERLARRHGWRLQKLSFDESDDLSAPVADLHRAWYATRSAPAERLVVGSFGMLDPWTVLATGSVPFWLEFGVEAAAAKLERYLDEAEPFDEILVTAFPHGVESLGLADGGRWEELARRARRSGRLVGIDARAYPRDLAAYLRFGADLASLPRSCDGSRCRLALDEAERFLRADPRVAWTD